MHKYMLTRELELSAERTAAHMAAGIDLMCNISPCRRFNSHTIQSFPTLVKLLTYQTLGFLPYCSGGILCVLTCDLDLRGGKSACKTKLGGNAFYTMGRINVLY